MTYLSANTAISMPQNSVLSLWRPFNLNGHAPGSVYT
jgi:hypothetical protein